LWNARRAGCCDQSSPGFAGRTRAVARRSAAVSPAGLTVRAGPAAAQAAAARPLRQTSVFRTQDRLHQSPPVAGASLGVFQERARTRRHLTDTAWEDAACHGQSSVRNIPLICMAHGEMHNTLFGGLVASSRPRRSCRLLSHTTRTSRPRPMSWGSPPRFTGAAQSADPGERGTVRLGYGPAQDISGTVTRRCLHGDGARAQVGRSGLSFGLDRLLLAGPLERPPPNPPSEDDCAGHTPRGKPHAGRHHGRL